MSKLDELLRELCPEGVEYKTLGEIGKFYGGLTGKSKKDFEGGNEVFITYKNVYSNPALDIYPNDKVKIADGEKQRTLEYGDIVFTGSSETPDECGFSSVVTRKPGRKLYLNSFCFFFRLDNPKVLLPDFSKHLFRSSELRIRIGKTASGVTRYNVSKDKMAKVEIPLPPLEVQREIVRILDNFTNLTAELTAKLTAEFTARQRQYEFYRDKLLTFDVLKEGTINFCQRTLGEMFDFRNGLSKGKEFFGKGTPFIRYTDVYNHRTLRKKDITALVECTEDEKERLKVSRGDVLFTRTSETAEDIGWSSVMLDDMDDCVFNGFTIKATPKTKELLPEYCAYCFSTSDFRQYVTKHCAFTTRASLAGNTIAQYRMTIPPLDIQSRIVNVLDNFEKICSDLNIGLPAEIEARQKQYEYYRDKLLTFKEVAAT